jgi:NAD+ diphosphatase
MLQDIAPKKYSCTFTNLKPAENDIALYFDGKECMMKKINNTYSFPTFKDSIFQDNIKYYDIHSTISIDNINYFIVNNKDIFRKNIAFEMVNINRLRHFQPTHIYFGAITSMQIARWEKNNRYCGRCGSKMQHSHFERAMICPQCNNTVYPKICPAVTISIIHNDKILLARNKYGTFKKYGQIAGYVEIGETFEDTVKREAFEETGLKLKNIKYYKNQPWASTDAQMVGYIAEVDGSPELHIQESELQDARWFAANEIPENISDTSLTYEMIGKFRREYMEKLRKKSSTGEIKEIEDNSNKYKDFFDIV